MRDSVNADVVRHIMSPLSQYDEGDVMHVSERLKRLRERAGMSKTELAKALGYKYLGGYHFESPDRKADFLPVPTAVKLIEIMKPRGIAAEEILELAGIPAAILKGGDSAPPNLVNIDYVKTSVLSLVKHLRDRNIDMEPEAQADVVSKLCLFYQSEVQLGHESETMSEEWAMSFLRFLSSKDKF